MEKDVVELVARALPLLLRCRQFSWNYDDEADVLYVTFEQAEATDSDTTDDDVVLRYRGDDIIGLTILHASSRGLPLPVK